MFGWCSRDPRLGALWVALGDGVEHCWIRETLFHWDLSFWKPLPDSLFLPSHWKQTGKVTQHKTGFLETSRNMELAKNQMRPPQLFHTCGWISLSSWKKKARITIVKPTNGILSGIMLLLWQDRMFYGGCKTTAVWFTQWNGAITDPPLPLPALVWHHGSLPLAECTMLVPTKPLVNGCFIRNHWRKSVLNQHWISNGKYSHLNPGHLEEMQ